MSAAAVEVPLKRIDELGSVLITVKTYCDSSKDKQRCNQLRFIVLSSFEGTWEPQGLAETATTTTHLTRHRQS